MNRPGVKVNLTFGAPAKHWCNDCQTSGGLTFSIYSLRHDGPHLIGTCRTCTTCKDERSATD